MTSPENSTTGTVYVLIDPRDNRVRYVGATTKTLKARLQGHKTRAAARVEAWIDELAAGGLTPRIEPINEGVPESQLRDREREEITRRVIAGEPLLNESATAQGRRYVERRRVQEREERERAAWEHVANQVRSILGGPLPPGDVPPIPLSSQAIAAYHSLLRAKEEADRARASGDLNLWAARATCVEESQARAAEALWRAVRPVWGGLRGMADQRSNDLFDDVLAGRVCAVFEERWADFEDAARYLPLLPWRIVAVGPWAALAERAGMDARGNDFIEWVSDDATVRAALRILLVRSGGRIGPLSALDNFDNLSRPSTGLVAMTAAHHPGFDLPSVLNMHVKGFLESMLRDKQLTPAMGDLLCRLEPRALDRYLGPNIAADVDAQLSLPPGTSKDVLAAVLEGSGAFPLGRLEYIVSRAKGAFPTVEAPNFTGFSGTTVPMIQAVTVSLMASGVLAPRSGRTAAELVDEIRALWRGDRDRLERAA